ncbi:MAG: fimbrial assembly protein [Acidobacteriaceae bacterium]
MRIQLNLASRPFIELGPLYLRLRILIVLLAVVAVPLWLLLATEKRKAAEAQVRLDAVQQRIHAIEAQRQSFQSSMREPQNAAVLTQSQFLNQLFARKSFSWTAVMVDLENVLPSGVQVLNIDPVPTKDGKVTIRLRVSGAHDRGVDLVRNLEHSHRFLAPRLARETAESNQNGRQIEQVSASTNVNFDLLAEYNPLPETEQKWAAAKQAATKKADATGKSARAPRHARKAAGL